MSKFQHLGQVQQLTAFRGGAQVTNGLYGELQFGHGRFFQVAADCFALSCQLRPCDLGGPDYTAGAVAMCMGDIAGLQTGSWRVMQQNEVVGDLSSGKALLNMTGGQWVWFVPAGARLAGGEPHPHAGTGFGMGHVIQVPVKADLLWDYQDLLHKSKRWKVMYSLTFRDGELHVGEPFNLTAENPFVVPAAPITQQMEAVLKDKAGYLDWQFRTHGLGSGVADGEDLLMPAMATPQRLVGDVGMAEFATESAGVMRWTCEQGTWRPLHFVPIAITVGPGQQFWHEPCIVRLADGSLLFSARGRMGPYENTIRLWHSPDGLHWHTVMDRPNARAESPVVLNQAADGTPYLAYNPWRAEDVDMPYGNGRSTLVASPLSPDGKQMLSTDVICDTPRDANGRTQWYLDHPLAATVRSSDGKWRHFLTHRCLFRGTQFQPNQHPTQPGSSIIEISTPSPSLPPWQF